MEDAENAAVSEAESTEEHAAPLVDMAAAETVDALENAVSTSTVTVATSLHRLESSVRRVRVR